MKRRERRRVPMTPEREQRAKAAVAAINSEVSREIRGGRVNKLEKLGLLHLGTDKNGRDIHLPLGPREKHCHVIGQTGKGKSKLLEYMVRQDIRAGRGVCLIDPHGSHKTSLYHNTLRWLVRHPLEKSRAIHLIEPGNAEWTTGLNPLHLTSHEADPFVVADNVCSIFERVWEEDFKDKPLIQNLLPAMFVLLMEHGLTLSDAAPIFTTDDPLGVRQDLIAKLENEEARIALGEIQGLLKTPQGRERYRMETMGPLNRLARFTRIATVKRMLGVTGRRSIDFRSAMDAGDIILVNLQDQEENFSEQAADLIGTMVVHELLRHAKRRPAEHPPPFLLYLDECQRFLTRDIPGILDEARKFGLHAVLSHQRIGQLERISDDMLDAVRSNTHVKLVFGGMSMTDAKQIVEESVKFDLERPVDALTKPTVVGYRIRKLKSTGTSTGTTKTIGVNESDAEAHTDGWSVTIGTASGRGKSDGESTGTSLVPSYPDSPDIIVIETAGALVGVSEISSESSSETSSGGTTRTHTKGASRQEGQTKTSSQGEAETLEPIMKEMVHAVYDMEKLRYAAGWSLRYLEARRLLLNAGELATFVEVPTIHGIADPEGGLDGYKAGLFSANPYTIPREEAQALADGRQHSLSTRVRQVRENERVKKEDGFDAWE